MLTIFAGMAQFERSLLLQRCNEGRAIAVVRGTKMGRPKKGGKQLEFAMELYKNRSKSLKDICEITGISRATLYRRLKELGLTAQASKLGRNFLYLGTSMSNVLLMYSIRSTERF